MLAKCFLPTMVGLLGPAPPWPGQKLGMPDPGPRPRPSLRPATDQGAGTAPPRQPPAHAARRKRCARHGHRDVAGPAAAVACVLGALPAASSHGTGARGAQGGTGRTGSAPGRGIRAGRSPGPRTVQGTGHSPLRPPLPAAADGPAPEAVARPRLLLRPAPRPPPARPWRPLIRLGHLPGAGPGLACPLSVLPRRWQPATLPPRPGSGPSCSFPICPHGSQ